MIRSALVLLLLVNTLTPQAFAEILCSQAKLKNGKIKLSYTFVDTASCPKGLTEVLDTDDLSQSIRSQISGVPGPKGDKGDTGAQGIKGDTGAQGLPGANGSPDTPTDVLAKLLQVDGPSSGIDAATLGGFSASALSPAVLYTRWGRQDCPSGASLVYEGMAATSHYTYTGSGVNILCASKFPSYAEFSNANQNGALLYGLEYETNGYGLASFSSLQNFDVPCAVCMRDNAKIVFMHPGSDICPAGFNLEYPGYLMSTHYTQTKSEFICVDQLPTAVGSAIDNNGGLLYPTESECGSLPCPPYVQDREVTCSVCSKLVS